MAEEEEASWDQTLDEWLISEAATRHTGHAKPASTSFPSWVVNVNIDMPEALMSCLIML